MKWYEKMVCYSMKDKDNLHYVRKIIEYWDIVNELLNEYGNDYLEFQSSKSFQLSTIMCIIQIGEYVSRIDYIFNKFLQIVTGNIWNSNRNLYQTHQSHQTLT